VLREIGRSPNANAGLVAQSLSIDPSTLTGILKRLERRKLVTRLRDSTDRRRALFRLTRAGKRLAGVRTGTVEAAVLRTSGRVGHSRLAAANLTLEVLAKELARD
jgi:DNA-binding MarR family transcriptional regulator